MRVTTRSAAIALWVCCFATLPSYADERPRAHLEGFRCEVVWNGETPPGMPVPTVVLCQIDDGADPMNAGSSPSTARGVPAPPLDSLLNLLTTLDHALYNSPPPQHDASALPPPTP